MELASVIAVFFLTLSVLSGVRAFSVSSLAPAISPATGLPNQFYTWKEGVKIRYQCNGPVDGEPILLVHGLFVNADHWRKALVELGNSGYRVYAVDLLGYGYSDRPAMGSHVSQKIDGEIRRFNDAPSILKGVPLGTSQGGSAKRMVDIDLRHPLGSHYNFFTWADLLTDFARDVIVSTASKPHSAVTLMCNSIGTTSSLQALMDAPDLFRGVFVVCPNFRELHSAEVPVPSVVMPFLQAFQGLLRKYGQALFDAAATPSVVKQILQKPYARIDAVDDTLVQVLLDPLLTPSASHVVFDTLSYSAGPLPEQQLGMLPPGKPVWICYGRNDPWTPARRVEALQNYPSVERVVGFDGVGHCPHDEAPELVHPLLVEFLNRTSRETPSKREDGKILERKFG